LSSFNKIYRYHGITATKYLEALADGGFVEKQKFGRAYYYVNVALNNILKGS
jgi:hypothetical protein